MRTFLPVVWTAAATCVLAAPHPSPSTLPRISRARRSPQDSWDARQSHSVLPPPGLSLSSPHKEPTGPRGTSSTHPTHRTTRQLVSTPRRSSDKQEESQGSDDSSTSPALSTFFRALRSPLPENPEKDPEGPVKDTDARETTKRASLGYGAWNIILTALDSSKKGNEYLHTEPGDGVIQDTARPAGTAPGSARPFDGGSGGSGGAGGAGGYLPTRAPKPDGDPTALPFWSTVAGGMGFTPSSFKGNTGEGCHCDRDQERGTGRPATGKSTGNLQVVPSRYGNGQYIYSYG